MSTQSSDHQRSRLVLTASEVGRYVYCRRAWWLQRAKGYEPDNIHALQLGTDRHAAHGQRVSSARADSQLARVLLLIAGLCAAGLLLLMVYR
jgi:hypothetical protein